MGAGRNYRMNNLIKKSVFEKLLAISEMSDAVILEKYARKDFGDDFDNLVKATALTYSRELEDIPVFDGDYEHTSEIIRRNGKNMYRSSSGALIEVEASEINLYQLNFDWLIRQILNAFGVRDSFNPRVLLEDNIWLCGQQWIEQKKKSIILVRNINNQLAFEHLTRYIKDNHTGRDPALILALNKNAPLYFHIPGYNVLLKIEDAMEIYSEYFELNLRVISDRLGGRAMKDGFSPDFRTLRFDGIDYSFTTTESEAIKVMAKARRSLSQHAILEGMNSTRKRLRDIFKQGKDINRAWGAVIKLDGKGMYWLDERIPIPEDI